MFAWTEVAGEKEGGGRDTQESESDSDETGGEIGMVRLRQDRLHSQASPKTRTKQKPSAIDAAGDDHLRTPSSAMPGPVRL